MPQVSGPPLDLQVQAQECNLHDGVMHHLQLPIVRHRCSVPPDSYKTPWARIESENSIRESSAVKPDPSRLAAHECGMVAEGASQMVAALHVTGVVAAVPNGGGGGGGVAKLWRRYMCAT